MKAPERGPEAAHAVRPPSPRERVLAAATEALLGRPSLAPASLVTRLLGTLEGASGAPRKRP